MPDYSKEALDRMAPEVHTELRRLARHYLTGERNGHTLQPTALVHEAYIRLTSQRSVDWCNRAQFVALAASMMRRICESRSKTERSQTRLRRGSLAGGYLRPVRRHELG